MRWIKRILLGVAVVLALLVIAVWAINQRANRIPDWYQPRALSDADRVAAARRAENLWADAQARIADAYRVELRDQPATQVAATPDGIQVTFSADELNAFFNKWSSINGWDHRFDEYLEDPRIVLHDGRLILAGKIRNLDVLEGKVASVHFEPRIESDGSLDLRLIRVLAGRMPLPQAVWSAQRDRLTAAVRRRLPNMQRQARIAPNGDANSDAVGSAMGRLFLQMMTDRPAEPVVFVPLFTTDGTQNIPVKVTAIAIEPLEPGGPECLTLTVQPMTPDERADFLRRLQKPPESATAMTESRSPWPTVIGESR